ncbi:MAG: hypothetical protein SPG80_01585 [Candidatus Ventricola sp.]|nr:hypothetical protein [Candidatus Ventricola sp.]
MLDGFGERAASLIFWLLFLVFALYAVGVVVWLAAAVVCAVQAAALYIRIAREEWTYGEGAWPQFVRTQRMYLSAVTRREAALGAEQTDPDQAFLDAYSGGGETVRARLIRWGKRLVFVSSAGIVWIPAMAVHAAALLAGTLLGCFDR